MIKWLVKQKDKVMIKKASLPISTANGDNGDGDYKSGPSQWIDFSCKHPIRTLPLSVLKCVCGVSALPDPSEAEWCVRTAVRHREEAVGTWRSGPGTGLLLPDNQAPPQHEPLSFSFCPTRRFSNARTLSLKKSVRLQHAVVDIYRAVTQSRNMEMFSDVDFFLSLASQTPRCPIKKRKGNGQQVQGPRKSSRKARFP